MRMRCKRCGDPPVIDIPRHRAAFCGPCFVHHCREQVRRVVVKQRMIGPGEKALVAVSGGKDSLMVWDVLLDLGYEADGVYLGLGIGEYSDESGTYARTFAQKRGLTLHEVPVEDTVGAGIPAAAKTMRRPPCSVCGLSKRHLLNRVTLERGYDVLVTGHNLDDEAAVLFGNVLNWKTDYMARQRPVLPAGDGLARRVKPLVRLGERETAAYCIVRGIDYQVEECPMAAGNRHLRYKEALNSIEERSPGTKAAFYLQFLDSMLPLLGGVAEDDRAELASCVRCGTPTTGQLCAFCRLTERVTASVGGGPVESTASGDAQGDPTDSGTS
jgi:tRNA-5-methyluridine54 2-sulfurtransferase